MRGALPRPLIRLTLRSMAFARLDDIASARRRAITKAHDRPWLEQHLRGGPEAEPMDLSRMPAA